MAASGAVQVDHAVSLGNAWEAGARRLPQAGGVALANDPLNLLTVDGATKGSKSDQDAAQRLPPDRAFACEMAPLRIAVKARCDLWATAPEKNATAGMRSTCPEAGAAGAAPLHRGDPGYHQAVDRDGDGVACET